MRTTSTILCPECKEEIPRTSRFCPECGSSLNHCIICSKTIQKHEEIKICPLCHTRFHSDHIIAKLKETETCPNCTGHVKEIDLI